MRDPNSLTPMEYYDIHHILGEYCILKQNEIKTSMEPHYVKDVMEAKVVKTKKVIDKMKRRMQEFHMSFCC